MNNKYLYSPWRQDYIQSEKPDDCVLCRHQDMGKDEENLIVYRGKLCYVMLNRYPYNNGHIMLIPYAHIKNLRDLADDALIELSRLMQSSETVLQRVYHCDGINIGINLGTAAGAGIEEHLHMHMVPRWNGDNNFMSVVCRERVIPESFEKSFTMLKDAYIKLLDNKD